jgi:predicted nucleic acid-binding protein
MAASGSTPKRGRYLLDTNIVTALFKHDAAVHTELAAASEVLLSSTVLGELYYGAARSGQPRQNLERLEEFAATCNCSGHRWPHRSRLWVQVTGIQTEAW